MQKLLVRQLKSNCSSKQPQIRTLKALGLGRIGKTNILTDTPAIRGMIRKVIQWVEVKHVEA